MRDTGLASWRRWTPREGHSCPFALGGINLVRLGAHGPDPQASGTKVKGRKVPNSEQIPTQPMYRWARGILFSGRPGTLHTFNTCSQSQLLISPELGNTTIKPPDEDHSSQTKGYLYNLVSGTKSKIIRFIRKNTSTMKIKQDDWEATGKENQWK